MLEQITIPKLPNTSFPEHISFEYLRKLGLEHIEDLGSAIWTDYNIHDPGITILEVLCYALTDLGYRTQFDIKDLLTQEKGAEENNFFTAAQMLTCNPITVNDFRKLLIDLPGVKNAWLEATDKGEIPVYLNKKVEIEGDNDLTARFQYEIAEGGELKIKGLYNVCIEFEDRLLLNNCGQPIDKRAETLEQVYVTLNQHRNLCEDLKDVIFYDEEGIAICADIELTPDADVEEVMLEIYKKVEEFLSPTLYFYTLQELLEKGKPIEEIFEGRPFSENSHGFIDTEELEKLTPRKKLYASDLIQVVMDVKGVLAVRKFFLVNYIDNIARTKGEPWCITLNSKYLPHFDFQHSSINFYKGVLPQGLNKITVKQRYLEEKLASNKSLLEPYQLDLEVPKGNYNADLSEYTSIQNDFPLTYGIGEEGIRDIATAQRQAQAKQLKAYLLFFDQILANYLSQIASVRSLFSIQETDGIFKIGQGTYATQSITAMSGVTELILNPNDCPNNDSDQAPPDDYFQYLNYITEDAKTFYQRKNKFLDHLLARFGESFNDYVLLMYEANGVRKSEAQIIQDKSDFLQSYPEISRNRGRAFDYTKAPVWDTDNVAGLKKRVFKLLGIDDVNRRTLAPTEIRTDSGGWSYLLGEGGNPLLKSKEQYESEAAAISAGEATAALLSDGNAYRRLTCIVRNELEYRFYLVDEKGEVLTEKSNKIFDSCEAVEAYIKTLSDSQIVEEGDEGDDAEGIIVITQNDERQIVIKRNEEIILQGKERLTPSNFNIIKKALLKEKQYCKEKTRLDILAKYRFLVVDENGICLAESIRSYTEEDERNQAIQQLIGQALFGSEIECVVQQAEECYFYNLNHYANEEILFKSQKGYATQTLAEDAFYSAENVNSFFVLAQNPDHYCPNEIDGNFSFKLTKLDAEEDTERCNGKTIVAYHPNIYAGEVERNYRMQMVYYYLNSQDIASPVIDGTEGEFQFEIRQGETIIFVGTQIYQTQLEAHKAARKALRKLAKYRVYYQLIDNLEGELPFGFELLDRNGAVIATHPIQYATACARDLAVDNIIYCLNNELPEAQIFAIEDRYLFELIDEEEGSVNTILMRSAKDYESEEDAKEAWSGFLDLAASRQNYESYTEEDGTFSFRLNNLSGEPIAVHPTTYDTEAERNLGLQSVLNRICFTQFDIGTSGIDGELTVKLLVNLDFDDSEEEILLLESFHTYADHVKAEEAFWEMIELTKERENYFPEAEADEPLTIELRDVNGDPFASSPITFDSREEREAFIEMLMTYVRKETIQYEITNETGAFFVEIKEPKSGQVILKGTEILPTQEAAEERRIELLEYAGKYSSYIRQEEESGSCTYRFALQDEEGNIIAIHPKKYVSTEERAAAFYDTFLYLTNGKAIADEIVYPKYGYRYEIKNEAEELLLSSTKSYANEDAADEAFQNHLAFIIEESSYEPVSTEDLFALHLKDEEDNLIAEQVPTYSEESEAIAALQALIFYFKTKDVDYEITSNEEGLFQIILRWESNIFLYTEHIYLEEAEAQNALLLLLEWAKQEVHYEKNEDGESCEFGFALKDENEVIVATHPTHYPDAESRDAVIENYTLHLNSPTIEPSIREEIISYGYAIRDFQDKLLIQSATDTFPTADEAKTHYLEVLLPLAKVRSNYQLLYDNDQCIYNFELRDENGMLIGEYDSFFTSRDQRDQHIDYLIALLCEFPINSCVTGTGCGFYYTIECGDIKLEGQHFFPSKIEAERACNKLKSTLLDSANYKHTEGYVEIWNEEELLLKSTTTVEHEDFVQNFIDKLEAAEAVLVSTEEPAERQYCVLLDTTKPPDEQNILLTSSGKSSEEEDCSMCNELLESIQDQENFCLITDEDACFYGFDLVNEEGIKIASHDAFYDSETERDKVVDRIVSLGNNEGMHLIEHILLRPKNKGNVTAAEYTFEIKEAEELLLVSDQSFSDEAAALACLNILADTIQTKNADELEQELQEKSGISILKEDGTTVLAQHPCPLEDVAEFVERLKALLAVEDLDLNDFIVRISPEIIEEADALMNPIMDGCTLAELTPKYSNPYSFRATVVLPYWTQRFRNWEFRSFVEQTLRREAPAHVYLRICWIDACQMKAFETAYREWLEAQLLGETGCNRTEKLNAFIKILSELKNIYPEANLFDCEGAASENSIVLNHTVLGTA